MFEWLFGRKRKRRSAGPRPERAAPAEKPPVSTIEHTPLPPSAPRPAAEAARAGRTAEDVLRELERLPTRRPAPQPAAEEKPVDPNLGRHLLAEGPVTREFLKQQLAVSGKAETYLGQVLARIPVPAEDKLFRLLAAGHEIPMVDLKQCKIMASVARSLPIDLVRKYRMVPIELFGDLLCVVFAGEVNPKATEAVRRATGLRVKALRCPPHHLELLVRRLVHEAAAAPAAPAPQTPPQVVQAVAAPETEPDEALRSPEARWESAYVSRGPLRAVRIA